ncbi:MAG: hypothetical protein P8X68_20920 [Desulfobacterales bacterium]
MLVSSYQIHNVLNVYSKQLSQAKGVQKEKTETKKPLSDQINLSAEGKRRATIERVADIESDSKKEKEFEFNFIDVLNRKTKTALSVKDTNFLIGRPEEPAKEAVEKDSDS